MENKKKAVSYYRKSKYGKSYTEADLDALYQKSYSNYDDVDLIEFIFDEFDDNSGYEKLMEMCNKGEIDIIFIPSIPRVFYPISKASEFFCQVLSFSKPVTIFCAFEKMVFAEKEYTRKYFEILVEFAEKESEKKSQAMSDSIQHMPPFRKRNRK